MEESDLKPRFLSKFLDGQYEGSVCWPGQWHDMTQLHSIRTKSAFFQIVFLKPVWRCNPRSECTAHTPDVWKRLRQANLIQIKQIETILISAWIESWFWINELLKYLINCDCSSDSSYSSFTTFFQAWKTETISTTLRSGLRSFSHQYFVCS